MPFATMSVKLYKSVPMDENNSMLFKDIKDLNKQGGKPSHNRGLKNSIFSTWSTESVQCQTKPQNPKFCGINKLNKLTLKHIF